ncbi:MAG: PAS domain S-box protein, partial [Deltaproteobacteria bacterium]|nr:PAS domain S-box protein [Deltaproteobacteria bacterium]
AFINDKLRLPVVLYVVSLLVVLIGGMITFRQYGMRQDTEEKLLESRRLLRTVFDTIPHALFAKNREQRYIMVNEALSEMFKVRPQDCIGRTINDFKAIGEEAKQQINSRDNQVIQEGRPVLETIRMRFEDGKESFREIIKLPLFDEKHKIIGMVGVSQDVTERHIAETMLRKSEQRYRTLIEGTIQGIIILQQKRPVFANNAAAGLFRFADCEDLLRLDSLEPLLSADDYPVLWQAWEKNQAEKPGEPLLVNIRCRCHDNSEIRVEAFLSEVVWEDAPAVMIALMDVTERDQLEEKLRQSQKMEAVGQLAGGIAHDINNTFQVIMLNTEAMLETEKSERTREKLESIQRSISTSSSTISQLLTFGKLDNLVRKNLKINDLIRHSTNLLKRLIGENIELALNLDPQAGYVNVDPGMIQQVILNLCINSRDAMPNGGRLEISSQFFVTDESFLKTHQDIQAGEYALVRVSDSGHGMSEEVLQKVFEPFFSTKPVGKGTGLGLSMVHGIIRQHGGYIDLQSAVGGGTTVSIYLSASAEQPRKEMQAPKARHVEGKGKTILIAEDEKELLDNLQEMLLLKGFCVIAANNGEEALEMLNAEQDIDMAILDMIMPKVSGQMLYEQIRKTHPRLPVLFTTGYSTVNFKDFVREDGLVRMIQKPYNSNDLFENISNLCS